MNTIKKLANVGPEFDNFLNAAHVAYVKLGGTKTKKHLQYLLKNFDQITAMWDISDVQRETTKVTRIKGVRAA